MHRALPINEIERDLVHALARLPRLVIQAPTGSGKSTQVPQMILENGLAAEGQVVVLQPRRLPTRLLADWVARQRGVPLGAEVGYQVRLDNRASTATRIKFETEGVLLRQMLSDPELRGVSAILFDEFHERHLYGDVTLARALQLQKTLRPDLKLVVMSATLEAGRVTDYLAPCERLTSEGRTFPVTHEYLSRPADPRRLPLWDLAAREFERLTAEGREGDVLIFMPGAYDIHRTVRALQHAPAARDCVVLPLHGELPPGEQDAAVDTYDRRKVVVATNVAETSLTIDGVRLVIDSGLARIPRFDPHRGINTLLVEKISRASADQRAGRAGRTAPGHCMRLWTEREHRERALQEVPEIRRVDLSEVVLTLRAGGVRKMEDFPWFEPPASKSLARAEQLLEDLGAGDPATGQPTPLGRRMLAFPVHPRYARMLMAAGEWGCVRPVALLCALSQGRPLLVRTRDEAVLERRAELFGDETDSDFFLLLRAWRFAEQNHFDPAQCRPYGIHAHAARQVAPLFRRFLQTAESVGLSTEESAVRDDAIQQCVLLGFSDQVARRRDGGTLRCDLVHGRTGELARESVVRQSPLLVASEIHEIEGRRKEAAVLLTSATAVKEEWLRDLFPNDITRTTEVRFDRTTRRVIGLVQKKFRDLVLESRRTDDISDDEAARILAGELWNKLEKLKRWDHAAEQYLQRIACLREAMPELDLPEISDETRRLLLEQLCHGARSLKEMRDRPVLPVMRSLLTPPQQDALDKFAPERLTLPGGRRVKVAYASGVPPTIAARIQDLYGVERSLVLPGSDRPVLVQVLAPNHRPVQITRDLAVFWRETYPRVKAELQKKYPRHEWR